MAARKQKQKRMSAQVVEDEDYQLRYEVAAGIDVAKESAVVCVRMPPAAGRKHRTSHLQTVPATVPAIGELAAELTAAGVQMVSMEATSDYWRIWFAVLEEAGLAVQLVSSSQARNLPGRPKTDKEDARWIARLTEMGMLRSIDLLDAELRDLQERVTAHLAAIPGSWGVDADGVTGLEAGRAADAAALPAAERLDEIPGLGREAAAALIAEIGLDMSRFP